MSEILEPLEEFFPLLVGSYIRINVIDKCIKNEDNGNKYEPIPVKFKIAEEYYKQIVENKITSTLLGLSCDYDVATSILTVTPAEFVLEMYKNPIMKEVVIKQAIDFKVRYSKFIELV